MPFEKIEELEKYSEEILKKIREELKKVIHSKDFSIVTTGSYGRKEASEVSDLDLFIVVDDSTDKDKIDPMSIQNVIDKYIKKETGLTGTFGAGAIVSKYELLSR